MSNEFKMLVARVSELEDRLAKMKRYYEDALSNLDDSNFAVAVVKERNNMKAKITMTAEEIRTSVERIDEKFKSYSDTTQTAELIKSTVTTEYVDGLINEKYSTVSQTNDKISTAVAEIQGNLEKYATLEIMDDKIMSKVGIDFTGITERSKAPDSNSDKTKVYKVGNKYYYWNGVDWATTENYGIFSCFTQTQSGFKFKGDFSSTTNENTTVDISDTRILIYNESGLPKLSMGFDKMTDTAVPVIKFGAGDGENSITTDGFTLYREQGYIAKHDNGFDMVYYTDAGDYHGMFISRINNETTLNLCADKILFNGSAPSAVAVFG